MQHIDKTIDVQVPLSQAYNQWTQFESFPRFMMNVLDVRQIDATHVWWRASIGGRSEEWTTEITRQEPDRLVAWRSTSGLPNEGSVRFEALAPDSTRIRLSMDFQPLNLLETVAAATGLVARRIEHDLEKFKELLEETGHETGAWRGRVERGDVVKDGLAQDDVAGSE